MDKFNANREARTKDGSNLIHIAAKKGHVETALVCLKRGVSLHTPNKIGARALHAATAMGHVDIVRTLI